MSNWNENSFGDKQEEQFSPKKLLAIEPFFEIPDKPISLTCKESCTKWFMTMFNISFVFVSLSIIGFGVWMLKDETVTSYFEIAKFGIIESKNNESVSFLNSTELPETGKFIITCIIALGAVILFISLLGACGALFHNKIIIKTYAILICFMVVLQVVGLIGASINIRQVDWNFQDNMKYFIEKEYMNQGRIMENSLNNLQRELHCCGVYGHQDWSSSKFGKFNKKNNTTPFFPIQCCLHDKENENGDRWLQLCSKREKDYIHAKGCYTAVREWLEYYGSSLVIGLISMIFLQLAIVFIAFCLSFIFSEAEARSRCSTLQAKVNFGLK